MTNESQHPKHTSEVSDSTDLTRRQALKLALGVALAMAPAAALAEGEQRRPTATVGTAPPVEYVQAESEYVSGPGSSGEKQENQGSPTPRPLLPASPPLRTPPKKTP